MFVMIDFFCFGFVEVRRTHSSKAQTFVTTQSRQMMYMYAICIFLDEGVCSRGIGHPAYGSTHCDTVSKILPHWMHIIFSHSILIRSKDRNSIGGTYQQVGAFV